jgi:hypothetical protein
MSIVLGVGVADPSESSSTGESALPRGSGVLDPDLDRRPWLRLRLGGLLLPLPRSPRSFFRPSFPDALDRCLSATNALRSAKVIGV